MAHLRTVPGTQTLGFDADNCVLVLPIAKPTTLLLIAGADLTVNTVRPEIASGVATELTPAEKSRITPGLDPWEQAQSVRKVTVTGAGLGTTQLNAWDPSNRPWIKPLVISVVSNGDYRQAVGTGTIAPELLEELKKANSLRDAALRVAEDQMNSKVATKSNQMGDNTYGQKVYDTSKPDPTDPTKTIDHAADWCGMFAAWCYGIAAKARGVDSPFPCADVIASPEKGISWALFSGDATVLRYKGSDPYGREPCRASKIITPVNTTEFIPIDAKNPLLKGDVCLVRKSGGWQHVSLVHDAPVGSSSTFYTIDGNQGAPAIKIVQRSLDDKVDGNDLYAFLHLKLS